MSLYLHEWPSGDFFCHKCSLLVNDGNKVSFSSRILRHMVFRGFTFSSYVTSCIIYLFGVGYEECLIHIIMWWNMYHNNMFAFIQINLLMKLSAFFLNFQCKPLIKQKKVLLNVLKFTILDICV